MKIIKLIIFTLMPLIFIAQETNSSDELLVIDYTHFIHMKGLPSPTVVNAYLTANRHNSLYEMDFLNNSKYLKEDDSENGVILAIKPKVNDFIFKDHTTNEIFSIERVRMKPFLVRDSDTIFNWKLENDYKKVIGYNCQKATLDYRGRNYVAFFTTDVPFTNGPWKFGNLPGLILEIYSIDNVFKMVANKLQIKSQETLIENPFNTDTEKSISWEQFLLEYRKKYNQLKYYRSPDGGMSSIPEKGIETYIEN